MKIILSLLVVTLLLCGCQNRTSKYNECIKACQDNKTCVERGEGSDSGPASARLGICKQWSDTECKNICIKKYK